HHVVSHYYEGQIQKLRQSYRERRDAMLSALDRYGSNDINWTYPMGGMFIWLDLPQHIDATQLLQTSLEEANVAFVPGAPFFADRTTGKNTCRLSFSTPKPDAIQTGIERLSALIQEGA
ncbi:MAG: aminotransferase class I/II-fold pyridoxal phosphate-dependent enzyme, partial [Okeania sp. SIO3B3]|nr:aminotransferase class I/II-fold pyridoxal phosphate-dependent enzyme [Okeania sp. SIO3B3]